MPAISAQSQPFVAVSASPGLAQDLALNAARAMRAELMREWLRRQWVRRGVAACAPRWLALAGASLVCAVLAARHGFHVEITMLAIAVASLVSSIAGFAFSAICGAMLFHLSGDPVQVVQVMMTCSIANQAAMTWNARRDIDWHGLRVYLAGGAFGVMTGVWVLLHADRAAYVPSLGVFLLVYGAYMLVHKPMVIRRQHVALDFVMGLLGGVTGGAAGFPGAAVTIWCGMKGWDKARQRAVFQPFILIMQVVALLAITLARHPTIGGVAIDISNLFYIPASLLGTTLGLALYRRMSDNQFARVVNLLLIVSGLSYVL